MAILNARHLLALPWRWVGPELKSDDHDNTWWELRIRDLPDFFVAEETRERVLAEAPDALEAFLSSYENSEQWPLLPEGVTVIDLDPTREEIPEVSDSPGVAERGEQLPLIAA